MESTAVTSTTLSSVAYDEVQHLLELEFISRSVYRYFDIPASVHADLLEAASKGAYFNQEIRDRYPFIRNPERQD
jgi:hypothetical protein